MSVRPMPRGVSSAMITRAMLLTPLAGMPTAGVEPAYADVGQYGFDN